MEKEDLAKDRTDHVQPEELGVEGLELELDGMFSLGHSDRLERIGKLQDVSDKTAQSRYRYGIDKLRSILNDEVEK